MEALDYMTQLKLKSLMKKRRREKRNKREAKFETKSFQEQMDEYEAQKAEAARQKKIKDLLDDIRVLKLFEMDITEKRQELDQLLKTAKK